jgi:hypothetical protein
MGLPMSTEFRSKSPPGIVIRSHGCSSSLTPSAVTTQLQISSGAASSREATSIRARLAI